MGKPFRVKRNGKEIGQFKARAKGGRVVNLQTYDAEEARKRARAVVRGDYSWRKEIADNVKEVLDGSGGEPESDVSGGEPETVEATPGGAPAEVSEGVASSKPEAAGAESGPIPAVSGPPLPAVDPVVAANAAAADVFGSAGDLRQTLSSAGIDLGELMQPETLGALHIAGQDLLFQVVAPLITEKKPKPFELPEKFAPAVKILGKAWQAQLSRWNVSLDGVSPGALILLASAGMMAVQILALYKDDEPASQESAPEAA